MPDPLSQMTLISVIICTRNRAKSLRRTLDALERVAPPPHSTVELIVVDNGSFDATPAVVRDAAARHSRACVRYVSEPLLGQSRARNRGLEAAGGDVIAFTDDDVRPEADWLARLCAPILEGKAEASVGSVRLASHLVQPWMSPAHRAWVADTGSLDRRHPERMVGANMAFSRAVLAKVPAFDVLLGPGALGFGDDTLFSQQLKAAGYRIAPAFDAVVEHHFEEDRLQPEQWATLARKLGEVDAYISHHWQSATWPHPWRLLLLAFLQLLRRRAAAWLRPPGSPAPQPLLDAIRNFHARLRYLQERKCPRQYEPHGLVKRSRRLA